MFYSDFESKQAFETTWCCITLKSVTEGTRLLASIKWAPAISSPWLLRVFSQEVKPYLRFSKDKNISCRQYKNPLANHHCNTEKSHKQGFSNSSIMEVKNGVLEDVFSLQMDYFPLNHDYGRKGTLEETTPQKPPGTCVRKLPFFFSIWTSASFFPSPAAFRGKYKQGLFVERLTWLPISSSEKGAIFHGPAKDRTKMWACFQTFTDHFFSFETCVQFYFSGSFKTSRWKCALLLAEFSNESLQKSLNVTLSWEISPK